MASPNNNDRDTPIPGEGLSLLDLEHLPKAQYAVMRMVMREGECDRARLVILLTPDQLTHIELDATVQELLEQQWLVQAEECYRPNIRRKASRILSEFQAPRHNSRTLRGIWESIESNDDK